ncbi:MAG: TolC family protein [Planctomycetota bacterium]|nr:TolC family protein [Planctomycetota bacterium]
MTNREHRKLRGLVAVRILGVCVATGCVHAEKRTSPPDASQKDLALAPTSYEVPAATKLAARPAPTSEKTPYDDEFAQPLPVEAFVERALRENRTVQAAWHNVESLRYRIPQATTLDDPVASNSVFPIPSVAPQYSLMGYNPYNLTLAQQFPWFGTLKLRGEVAERDVQVALAELAAAQLDAVAAVKNAYYTVYAGLKTEELLLENRKVVEYFRTLALKRVESGGSRQDVLRAEVQLSELDRELATTRANLASARAALARQIHARPDAGFRTLAALPKADAPHAIERLFEVAGAARPELRGRLAAVARDEKAIELARKRFYPNITMGLTYMDMEKTNAQTPRTAGGMPNVGLFVAFNLPVHKRKYEAGVLEARSRAAADAKLLEAQADAIWSDIQDLHAQANAQHNVLALLRDDILPRSRKSLELARSDYALGNVDYATAQSALREVLQVELNVAQVEAELGKALAALERAVGCELESNPAGPSMPAPLSTPSSRDSTPPIPPPTRPGPFHPKPEG